MTDEPTLAATFGSKVKMMRYVCGLTQSQVASKMQDSGHTSWRQTTMSKVESGARPVTLDEADRLAKVLGTRLLDMLSADTGACLTGAESARLYQEGAANACDDILAFVSQMRDAHLDAAGIRGLDPGLLAQWKVV